MAFTKKQSLQGGKYVIEKELGGGRFGITYRAKDAKNDYRVIKTLNETLLTQLTPDERNKLESKFCDEAVKLAQCKHPHIVKIYEIFKEGDLWCIAMEYIDGADLQSRAQRILPPKQALRFVQQIGEALSELHRQGLLHRDVKPDNIMMRAGTSEAVLIDFGLARGFNHPLTTTNVTAEGYAPPELYSTNKARGAYTDVYSLAATLYNLVTGNIPPSALDRKIAKDNSQEDPVLIGLKNANFKTDDRIHKAIAKGMELDGDRRPQTMQEWLNLLGLRRDIPIPLPDWDLIKWLAIAGFVVAVLGTIAAWIPILKSSSPPASNPTSTAAPPTQITPPSQ